jgi:hypothetical protein
MVKDGSIKHHHPAGSMAHTILLRSGSLPHWHPETYSRSKAASKPNVTRRRYFDGSEWMDR